MATGRWAALSLAEELDRERTHLASLQQHRCDRNDTTILSQMESLLSSQRIEDAVDMYCQFLPLLQDPVIVPSSPVGKLSIPGYIGTPIKYPLPEDGSAESRLAAIQVALQAALASRFDTNNSDVRSNAFLHLTAISHTFLQAVQIYCEARTSLLRTSTQRFVEGDDNLAAALEHLVAVICSMVSKDLEVLTPRDAVSCLVPLYLQQWRRVVARFMSHHQTFDDLLHIFKAAATLQHHLTSLRLLEGMTNHAIHDGDSMEPSIDGRVVATQLKSWEAPSFTYECLATSSDPFLSSLNQISSTETAIPAFLRRDSYLNQTCKLSCRFKEWWHVLDAVMNLILPFPSSVLVVNNAHPLIHRVYSVLKSVLTQITDSYQQTIQNFVSTLSPTAPASQCTLSMDNLYLLFSDLNYLFLSCQEYARRLNHLCIAYSCEQFSTVSSPNVLLAPISSALEQVRSLVESIQEHHVQGLILVDLDRQLWHSVKARYSNTRPTAALLALHLYLSAVSHSLSSSLPDPMLAYICSAKLVESSFNSVMERYLNLEPSRSRSIQYALDLSYLISLISHYGTSITSNSVKLSDPSSGNLVLGFIADSMRRLLRKAQFCHALHASDVTTVSNFLNRCRIGVCQVDRDETAGSAHLESTDSVSAIQNPLTWISEINGEPIQHQVHMNTSCAAETMKEGQYCPLSAAQVFNRVSNRPELRSDSFPPLSEQQHHDAEVLQEEVIRFAKHFGLPFLDPLVGASVK
eukprot:GILK01006648.1.p1 GENE.GILK01006648.1~~GILK01006648.1.p1  ORF type:complete len:760 (-),score=112.40 GILK01006648.1:290-2527(-)